MAGNGASSLSEVSVSSCLVSRYNSSEVDSSFVVVLHLSDRFAFLFSWTAPREDSSASTVLCFFPSVAMLVVFKHAVSIL